MEAVRDTICVIPTNGALHTQPTFEHAVHFPQLSSTFDFRFVSSPFVKIQILEGIVLPNPTLVVWYRVRHW